MTLIGANGAGKSTTLRSINGLNHPREGRIAFQGKDITNAAAARDREDGHRAVARGPAALPAHERAREPRDGRVPAARPGELPGGPRPRLRALPAARGAEAPEGGDAVRRRAADVRDRPRADGAPEAAPARRAVDGAGADLRREDLRDHGRDQRAGTPILLVEQNASHGARRAHRGLRRGGSRSAPRRRRGHAPSRARSRSHGWARSRASAPPGGRGSRRRRPRRAVRAPGRSSPSRGTGAGGWQARPLRYASRARVSAAARRSPAARSSAVRPSRSEWKRARYGSCVPCAKWRESRWRTIAVPSSRTGKASRQSRSASPSATDATVIGLSRSRGACWCFHGMPITIASSGCSSGVERRAMPAQQRLGVSDRGRSGKRCHRGQLAAEVLQQPTPDRRTARVRARRSGERASCVSESSSYG